MKPIKPQPYYACSVCHRIEKHPNGLELRALKAARGGRCGLCYDRHLRKQLKGAKP